MNSTFLSFPSAQDSAIPQKSCDQGSKHFHTTVSRVHLKEKQQSGLALYAERSQMVLHLTHEPLVDATFGRMTANM